MLEAPFSKSQKLGGGPQAGDAAGFSPARDLLQAFPQHGVIQVHGQDAALPAPRSLIP